MSREIAAKLDEFEQRAIGLYDDALKRLIIEYLKWHGWKLRKNAKPNDVLWCLFKLHVQEWKICNFLAYELQEKKNE